MFIMVRISRPAPTSSARVSAVCTNVPPRSSRRSPRPALLFGPALLSTCIGSSREARSVGKSPARSAAITAEPRPKASIGQPVETASRRGTACPPITLNDLTAPSARTTPSAPPNKASRRLSVDTCRKSATRPTPNALRTAYSCCRCRPRTSNRAAAIAIHLGSQRMHLRGEAFKIVIGLRLRGGSDLEFTLRLPGRGSVSQPPYHIPKRRFQLGRFGRSGNPEIDQCVHVVVRLLCICRRRRKTDAGGHHPDNL